MQYVTEYQSNRSGEFSVHHENIRDENVVLKAKIDELKKEKIDRIDRIERDLGRARLAFKQLSDSSKTIQKQADDIINHLKFELNGNKELCKRLHAKIEEQERDLQALKSVYDEQKEHNNFLDNILMMKEQDWKNREQECKRKHISREKLDFFINNPDSVKIQPQTTVQQTTPHSMHANELQNPATGTISINHSLPMLASGSKDTVMNSNYGSNIKAASHVDIVDKDREENIASNLSKLNLSTIDTANSSYTNIGGKHPPKLNGTNQNEQVPSSGLNLPVSSSSLLNLDGSSIKGTVFE